MSLRTLPRPDSIETAQESSLVCAIKDDGGPVAPRVATRLKMKGWQIVLLRTASTPSKFDMPTVSVADGTEGAWAEALASVHRTFGPITTFIELNSHAPSATTDQLLDSEADQRLRESFFTAKRLRAFLAVPFSRYYAVAQIDGRLGLSGSADAAGSLAGGIFGLAKTLRHEWTSTYCRAVDLSPVLDSDTAAERLIEELLDPDYNLSEVGVDPHGRYTLVVQEADHA